VLGRSNVGKSTLVNYLLGSSSLAKVSGQPGEHSSSSSSSSSSSNSSGLTSQHSQLCTVAQLSESDDNTIIEDLAVCRKSGWDTGLHKAANDCCMHQHSVGRVVAKDMQGWADKNQTQRSSLIAKCTIDTSKQWSNKAPVQIAPASTAAPHTGAGVLAVVLGSVVGGELAATAVLSAGPNKPSM